MMIAPGLLESLRCPATGQRLKPAPAALIARLESARAAGAVRDRSGNAPDTIQGGLVCEDGSLLYPIRGGIPVMRIEEAIPVGTE